MGDSLAHLDDLLLTIIPLYFDHFEFGKQAFQEPI